MKALNVQDITDQIAQHQQDIAAQHRNLTALLDEAHAEKDVAAGPADDLRDQAKAALLTGQDEKADQLLSKWSRAHERARKNASRWAAYESRQRGTIHAVERDLEDAVRALTLAQHLGAEPETYEEIAQAFDTAITAGKGMLVDVDALGETRLAHDELPQFFDELQMGEGIRVLALFP